MKFSIIVTTLNAGEKLTETIKSIAGQTYPSYQVIVKDGGSTDDSLAELAAYLKGQPALAEKTQVIVQKDSGIYDGMNQGIAASQGEYLYFLNCGDRFYEETVLQSVADASENGGGDILYGDIWDGLCDQRVASNPRIDAFACYRNVPCHQACFYAKRLFSERQFECRYRVRADYEHFLWCFFTGKVTRYLPVVIALYEGGGFSETKTNRIRSAEEHKEITAKYMKPLQRFRYRGILLLTLAPLRTKMAQSKHFAAVYNGLKRRLYGGRG